MKIQPVWRKSRTGERIFLVAAVTVLTKNLTGTPIGSRIDLRGGLGGPGKTATKSGPDALNVKVTDWNSVGTGAASDLKTDWLDMET